MGRPSPPITHSRTRNAWVLNKAKPLGEILVEQGALQDDTRPLLEAFIVLHISETLKVTYS